MTYFYMPVNTTNLVESEMPIDFNQIYYERYGLFATRSEKISAPTQIFSHQASERFQWCLDHLKTFEVFRTGFRSKLNPGPSQIMWLFYIPDPMEAMVFKLRWKSE